LSRKRLTGAPEYWIVDLELFAASNA